MQANLLKENVSFDFMVPNPNASGAKNQLKKGAPTGIFVSLIFKVLIQFCARCN